MANIREKLLHNFQTLGYKHFQRATSDVLKAMEHYPSLKLSENAIYSNPLVFTSDNNSGLVTLDGTVPVNVSGVLNEIPILIWILILHPYAKARVFVCDSDSKQKIFDKRGFPIGETGEVFIPRPKGRRNPLWQLKKVIDAVVEILDDSDGKHGTTSQINPTSSSKPEPTSSASETESNLKELFIHHGFTSSDRITQEIRQIIGLYNNMHIRKMKLNEWNSSRNIWNIDQVPKSILTNFVSSFGAGEEFMCIIGTIFLPDRYNKLWLFIRLSKDYPKTQPNVLYKATSVKGNDEITLCAVLTNTSLSNWGWDEWNDQHLNQMIEHLKIMFSTFNEIEPALLQPPQNSLSDDENDVAEEKFSPVHEEKGRERDVCQPKREMCMRDDDDDVKPPLMRRVSERIRVLMQAHRK